MSNYDNTNSGVLFKNDKKGNEKAPDYKGKVNVYLSAEEAVKLGIADIIV